KMHNAATIAGMAFTNAFLGVNHALGHKLGGEFDLPHGRANAVLIPHVIAYNASPPTKLTAWPKYEYYKAPERYREIAKHLGLPAEDNKEGVSSLIAAVRDLMQKVGMPLSIQECGVNEQDFFAKLPLLAEQAFEDQTVITNPRQPLISELEEILRKAWG
ncbi:MAG: iron-containing alcohol dehydrogenase, partial [Bacillota bacterium]|nr:iron-containing alcohol dehydrogenase [Bacillota bacterium]